MSNVDSRLKKPADLYRAGASFSAILDALVAQGAEPEQAIRDAVDGVLAWLNGGGDDDDTTGLVGTHHATGQNDTHEHEAAD